MPRLGSLLLLALLAGCTIEDRTPTGTRRDEDAIRAVLATYYRSLADRTWAGGRSVFWDSATVTYRAATGPATGWRTFENAPEYFAFLARLYRNAAPGQPGPRLVRTDFHQQGDMAAVWATLRIDQPDGSGYSGETGRVDHLVLRRIDGAWRVAYLVSVPDTAAVRP